MAANIEKIAAFIRGAATDGAQVILAPELFQGPYFARRKKHATFRQPILGGNIRR